MLLLLGVQQLLLLHLLAVLTKDCVVVPWCTTTASVAFVSMLSKDCVVAPWCTTTASVAFVSSVVKGLCCCS